MQVAELVMFELCARAIAQPFAVKVPPVLLIAVGPPPKVIGHSVAENVPVLFRKLPLPAIILIVVDVAVKTPGLVLFMPPAPAVPLKLMVALVALKVPVFVKKVLLLVTVNVEPEFKLTVPELLNGFGPPANVIVEALIFKVPELVIFEVLLVTCMVEPVFRLTVPLLVKFAGPPLNDNVEFIAIKVP